MGKIRSVKPEFWTSEQVTNCSRDARLLFIGLWNFCDDQGVHPDSAKRLKMEIFPADDLPAAAVAELLEELIQVGLVRRFECAGESYLHVTGWQKHQRVVRPHKRYPAPVEETVRTTSSNDPNTIQTVPEQCSDTVQAVPEQVGNRNWYRNRNSSSVAKATAGAVAPPNRHEIDPAGIIFGGCLQYLIQNGVPETRARSKLGEWRRDYGNGAVIDAVNNAKQQAVSEPVPWITKVLEVDGRRNRAGARPDDRFL